jgi:hypothetical protein
VINKIKSINSHTLVFLIFLVVVSYFYLTCITSDIYSGDLGDIVTAAFVFGVAHPPGYPLLVSLGAIFSHLPFPLAIVSRVTLVCLIASLLSLFFFFRFCIKITKNLVISILSVSILAFSYQFWFFSEIPEVFALNNLFVIVLIYFGFLFYQQRKTSYLLLFFFFLGLSLTNQLQIVTIYPALVLFIIPRLYIFLENKKLILFSLGSLILGLIPYV